MSALTTRPTVNAYVAAFEDERAVSYPMIDACETVYAAPTDRLLSAALILACPIKTHAPNWQHGRLIYAVLRDLLSRADRQYHVLDIGTAKGFSALCAQWALMDSGRQGQVVSVDVIDPVARVRRNTVAEVDGFLTLAELHARWPELGAVQFRQSTGIDWLLRDEGRIDFCFVDGKHDGRVVANELALLTTRQGTGDVTIVDDLQLPGVAEAVNGVRGDYALEVVSVLPHRAYAIARRR